MTHKEKFELLVSPEKYFPEDMKRGSLLNSRPFINAMERYLDILSESQYWTAANIKALQATRLRKLASLVSERSSFWADYFRRYNFSPKIAEIEDLRLLPVLDRKDLLKLGDNTHLNPNDADQPIYEYHSSGTTGVSLKHFYSERELLINFISFNLRNPEFEKIPIGKFLSKKSFVVLGMPGNRHAFEKDFYYKIYPTIRSVDLDDPGIRKDIYTNIIHAAPTFLVGYGSLIAKLAEWIIEDGVILPILAVRSTSEPISMSQRELILRATKKPIVNLLSGNGIGIIGFECPINQEFFHINSETVIMEIFREDKSIIAGELEGELVITSFDYILNPIIRYAHNDIAQIIDHPCQCGRTLPLIKFHGRRGYEIILPSGKKIRMVHLYKLQSKILMGEARLGRLAKQLQIIQDRIDGLQILIVPKKKISDADEIAVRLAVTELFDGEKMHIDIKCVDVIPSGRGRKPSFFVPLSEFQERKL